MSEVPNELVEGLARQAGAAMMHTEHQHEVVAFRPDCLQRFAQLVVDECIAKIQAELDHAAINNHRLPPAFGKRHGDPAVRASAVEAALDAIRTRFGVLP